MICDKIEECSEIFDKPLDNLVDPKGGKSKFSIKNINRNSYIKIDFENCVYEDRQNDTKCDYGLIIDDEVYFVELKGSDVSKGYKQLESTIRETLRCFDGKRIKARMVVTKFSRPDIAKKTTEYKNLVRLTNNDVEVKQNVLTQII
ncbi:MAG: hypothetical protein ACI9Y7_000337 [Dokdonia sp.]|jgi:hypothetical protein